MNNERHGGDPALFGLLRAAEALQERMERALQAVGISFAKYGALVGLRGAGEPIPLGELAAKLHCVRSNMTQLIDRLEADGLVQRTSDPDDRRVVRAGLTPLGLEKAEAGMRAIEEVEAEFNRNLSDEDRATIRRILGALG